VACSNGRTENEGMNAMTRNPPAEAAPTAHRTTLRAETGAHGTKARP